jgi:uncharacterized RDD family membrane protein YckC
MLAGTSLLGSWGARVGALLLDSLVLAVPMTVLLVAVSLAVDPGAGSSAAGSAPGWVVAVVYAVLVAVPAAYFTVLTGGARGQTVGGLATGLVVRDALTGGPLGYRRALARFLVRALLYAALVIPGVLNDLMPLWDPMHQSLSDKVTRALVVRPVGRGH